ncbi:hypothetical protein [Sneathia sanguinegens]|uniref:hypothetical protein n=1 Tax=Sneathia sanguinegens TaxID=40543 RepID=UPI00082B7889|nr:hypothetical protein [Sneathia sanguinegens]MDU4653018.1 hypothetical protein [Sneathia sanguinegens]
MKFIDYINKIKKHLSNPNKTCDEYFKFYMEIDSNYPSKNLSYDEEYFVDDIREVTEYTEYWNKTKHFKKLDEELRKVLAKYGY